ncbi:MAG: TIGR01244 family phosphatase [Rhodobacteraceae bacterium]|nr:TIGR01244 family phosphatase [Paracoccaceae bacterium]
MDTRKITETYSVAPQISPEDMPALAEAGFTHVLCNRPDEEIPANLHADTMRAAAEAAGLIFVVNPVSNAGMTPENIARQQEVIDTDGARILAYCRSGTRSTFVWGLVNAGRLAPETILEAAAEAGYDLSPLRPYLEAQSGDGSRG